MGSDPIPVTHIVRVRNLIKLMMLQFEIFNCMKIRLRFFWPLSSNKSLGNKFKSGCYSLYLMAHKLWGKRCEIILTFRTFVSDSSKQSTVRSRASTRSRSSSRRPDPKLEEEKVRAQLNLLYVEKQQVWIRLEPMSRLGLVI